MVLPTKKSADEVDSQESDNDNEFMNMIGSKQADNYMGDI